MKDDVEKLVLMKCISDSVAEFPYPMDLMAAMRAVYPRFVQMNDNPVNLENDNPIKVLTFKINVQITPALFNYLTRYDSRPSGVSSRFSFYTNEGFVYILYRNSIYNRLIKDALYGAGYSLLHSNEKVCGDLKSVHFVVPIPFYGQENFKESLLETVNRIYALLLDGLSYGAEA